ncbi:MAG: hypothetical protein LRY51_05505 [Geovibrio sp.]|nr:hypothetical protein [Geovibrio sp.]
MPKKDSPRKPAPLITKAHGFYEKRRKRQAEEAVREYRKQFPDAPHGLHSMLMGNICLKKQDKKMRHEGV